MSAAKWHSCARAADKGTLYGIASRVLAEAVRKRRRERGRFVSLERRLPERQALDEDIDEAVYDYWQPDQVLKLEDAVPIDARRPRKPSNGRSCGACWGRCWRSFRMIGGARCC